MFLNLIYGVYNYQYLLIFASNKHSAGYLYKIRKIRNTGYTKILYNIKSF